MMKVDMVLDRGDCSDLTATVEKSWDTVATNVPDPPACIQACKKHFLNLVTPGRDKPFNSTCQSLSGNGTSQVDESFWSLYCCDSVNCGVSIDPEKGQGQDPNVASIINECQVLGIHSVHDPGPPTPSYSCAYWSSPDGRAPGNQSKSFCGKPAASKSLTNPSSEAQPGMPLTLLETPSATIPTSTTVFPATTPSSQADATASVANVQSSNIQVPNSIAADQAVGDSNSARLKATIAVCTVVLFLAIAAAVAFFLIRRRRAIKPYSLDICDRINRSRDNLSQPAGSTTPLISPPNSASGSIAPLTPPLRLRDRKLLPTILGPGRQSSATGGLPVTPSQGTAYHVFPTSPICAPTVNKLIPRYERMARLSGRNSSPPLSRSATDIAAVPVTHRGSLSSFGSNQATTVSVASSAALPSAVLNGTPPSSPARPPRPQDIPLEIPGLLSPGPPPNRSLPTTPSVGGCASSIPATTIRPGDIGLALGIVAKNPAKGVVLHKDNQDLCELTKQYARESRDSWGSWGGSGGGGPGVAISPPRKASGAMNSPVLGEVDLERLGGRY